VGERINKEQKSNEPVEDKIETCQKGELFF